MLDSRGLFITREELIHKVMSIVPSAWIDRRGALFLAIYPQILTRPSYLSSD